MHLAAAMAHCEYWRVMKGNNVSELFLLVRRVLEIWKARRATKVILSSTENKADTFAMEGALLSAPCGSSTSGVCVRCCSAFHVPPNHPGDT